MSNTQEKAQHTGGPWAVLSNGCIVGGKMYEHPRGSAQKQIALTFVMEEGNGDQEANARRIVQCTNSHDELLTELQYAHAIITVLLNLVPDERKAEMAIALAQVHDGEGAVRYHERAAVIAKATGAAS